MNERIKELIKQYYDDLNEPSNDQAALEWLMNDLLPEYQRLAELIVQECSRVVCEQLEKEGDSNELWARGYIVGMLSAIRYMKEHFGVTK